MEYDVVIKNGLIVDGTGGAPYRGDVAVLDGRIAETGKVDGGAASTLDAEGQVVAPGFWDVHTHYDAQLLWDPIASSSSWHGVTNVVMGNCGITLAPCRAEDQRYMVRTLAHVEAMPEAALASTLPWSWENYADYLRALEPGLGINAGAFVGHTAIRRYVMGAEATERTATEAEVGRMKQVLLESLKAGALGFSTARVATHWDGEGRPVPSRVADLSEIYELASVLREAGRGFVQLAVGSDFNKYSDEGRERLSELARVSGRPVIINSVAQTTTNVAGWRETLDWMARMERDGHRIMAMGNVVPSRREFNLKYTDFFDRYPLWLKLSLLPSEEKESALRDPEHRARLRDDAENVQDAFFKQNPILWDRVILTRSRSEQWRGYEGKSVAEIATALGKHPVDTLFDVSLDEGLETQFCQMGNRNPEQAAQLAILRAPHVVPEQSDAGAHVVTENNTGFPSYMLGHWVREKQALNLEEAVWRMTGLVAQEFGVPNRGALKPGMAADVVVFDPEVIGTDDPEFTNDLPGGGRRLIQRGRGVSYTLVNGQVTLDHGVHTGAKGGQVIRSGGPA